MKTRILSSFIVFFAVLAVCVGFTNCKEDHMIGLGGKVDLSPPVVNVYSNEPGSYLNGEEQIILLMYDDLGISKIEIVYTFIDKETGELQPDKKISYPPNPEVDDDIPGVKLNMTPQGKDENGYKYEITFDLDTTQFKDGEFSFYINAWDAAKPESKKTTTDKLIYTVKNNPPTVNLQIPRQRTHSDGSINNTYAPTVVTDNYLMGVFEDLAGVAQGFPLLKFWQAERPEPTDFRQNTGWDKAQHSGTNKGNGWVRPDDYSKTALGERGGPIRYYLKTRNDKGEPNMADNNGLEPGIYKLKIYIEDINGTGAEWPRCLHPDGYKSDFSGDDFMLIEVVAFGIPPLITIDKPIGGTYYKNDFEILAKAEVQGDLDTDIAELCFEITGGVDRDGNKLPSTRNTFGGPIILARFEGDLNKEYKEFTLKVGETYYTTYDDDVAKLLVGNILPDNWKTRVTLVDGTYNINVFARGNAQSKHTESRTIYIDRNPPRTDITRVAPAYSQDASQKMTLESGAEDYRVYTVNKTIQIDVSASDTFGTAKDDLTGYSKFKYMFVIENSADDPESLHAIGDINNYVNSVFSREKYILNRIYDENNNFKIAKFLDEEKNTDITAGDEPVISIKEDGGAYTITLRTHEYNQQQQYNLCLYISALDGAGNANFQKILLKVDQNTDKPRITFGNINREGSPHGMTFMDDKFHIRFTVLDDNGLSSDSIQIRYAVNEAEMSSIDSGEGGWYNLSGTPSEDGLSIAIDDLNLLKIACYRIGGSHVYNQLTCTLDTDHKNHLGLENVTKYIQIRAKDNPKTKVYESDGSVYGETEWRPFKLDLTPPKIVPSVLDEKGSYLSTLRAEDNPFGSPVKEGSYSNNLLFAYGDITEQNLRTISVKIDGIEVEKYPKTIKILDEETGEFVDVLDEIEYGTQLDFNKVSIIRGPPKESEWAGELRFLIPIKAYIDSLTDGSHSFEITIEDKALQYDTRSITIYKDISGPVVDLIIPSVKYAANDNGNGVYDPSEIGATEYSQLQVNRLKDMNAKIVGNFSDRYSSIFNAENHEFEYKINSGTWQKQSIHEDNYNKTLVTWEILLPANLLDGIHYLSIRAKDIHGNQTQENNLVFMLDRSQPKLTITSIKLEEKNVSGTLKQGFTFKGTVTDTFELENEKFLVYVGVDQKEKPKEVIKNNAVSGQERAFEFEYWVRTEDTNRVTYLPDFIYGPNTILFEVEGSSEKKAIATGSIILDNVGPEVTFNTTGGEKITLSSANMTTINTTNAAGWTGNLKTLYENRVKDRSAFAKLSGRFTDEYSPIPKAGSTSFEFEYVIYNANGTIFRIGELTSTVTSDTTTSAGWDIPIPTATEMPDGIYSLTVIVNDRVGNKSGVNGENMAFMVDRSIPEVSISIAGGNNDEYDVFSAGEMTSKTVTVKVTNTYDVQNLTLNVNNAAKTTASSSSYKEFTYTYTFDSPTITGLAHGLQNISVTALGSSDQTRNAALGFNLDRRAPEITIAGKDKILESQFAPGNVASHNTALNNGTENPRNWNSSLASVYNVRLKDTAEKLTLNFADDLSPIKLDSFSYRINNGTWTNLALSAPADSKTASVEIPWSAAYAAATNKDGLYTLNVRISDTKTNETPATEYNQNIVFMVDTKVPTFAADGGASTVEGIDVVKAYSGNDEITIRGVVRNVFDVSRLGLIVNALETEIKGTEVNELLDYYHDTGKDGFPFVFKVPTSTFSHGTQSIIINAIGSSGKSAMASYNIVVDLEGPSITFSTTVSPIYVNNSNFAAIHGYAYGSGSINPTQESEYRQLYPVRVTDTGGRLTGTFTDEHSPIFSLGGGGDYGYWYKIDEINAAGNAIAEGTWKWEHIASPPANNFANWTINLDSSYKDGLYRLSMRVKDRLGNGLEDTVSNSGKGYQNNMTFMLDRTPPTLEITTVTQGFGPLADGKNNLNGVYVTGKISNTFEVKGVNVVVAQDKNIFGTLDAANDPPRKRAFNYDYWLQIQDDNDFVYGPNTMVVSASGSSGQSDMKTTSTTIDNRGPEISFNTTGGQKVYLTQGNFDTLNSANINASAWNNYKSSVYDTRVKDSSATAKLSGRFTDDYTAIPAVGGNYTFHYKITGDSAWNASPSNIEWKAVTMTSTLADARSVPWEITLSQDMPDGLYRLSMAATDRGGFGSKEGEPIAAINGTYYGYEADMAFMVNRKAPVLVITDLIGNNLSQDQVFNANTEIAFKGTITGTYAVDNFRLTKTDGVIENLSFTQDGPRTFTVSNKVLQEAAGSSLLKLGHGEQNISFSLTGSSDLASNVPYRFIVDREGPVVEIRGREKIKEASLDKTLFNINTDLGNGNENPIIWVDSLKTVFDERITDTNTKLTVTFFDSFSEIKADSFSYRINPDTESIGYKLLNIPSGNITNNGRNAFIDIPWAASGSGFIDGLNRLDIKIQDNKTNETVETSIVFMVDAQTPELDSITLFQDAQLGNIYSGSFPITVTGVIKNVYNVNRADIILGGIEIAEMGSDTLYAGSHPSGATLSAYDSINGGYNFKFILPSAALTHGTKSIMVNAAGTSGKSAMKNVNIIVDSEGPSITFNTTNEPIYLSDAELQLIQGGSLSSELAVKWGKLTTSAIKDQSARLMGNFIDEFSPIFSQNAAESNEYGYYYKIDKLNANNTITKGNWHWQSSSITASTSAGWSILLETDETKYGFPFDDGYYRLSIRVKDRLNNGYGAQNNTQISDVIPGEEINGGKLGYQNNMAFYMERGIPQIRIDSVVPSFTNKGFKITGEIWNANVGKLSVSLDGQLKYEFTSGSNTIGNSIKVDPQGGLRSLFEVDILTSDLTTEKSYPVMITVTGGSQQSNMVAANFTYDKTAPAAHFNMPTLGGNINGEVLSGNLSDNGKYSITVSTDWVTGIVNVGGTSEDSNGIAKIYYHFGKMSENKKDGDNDAQREALYKGDVWLDTGLDGVSSGFASGWTGGLFNWTYRGDMNQYENSPLKEEDVDSITSSGEQESAFYWPVYVKIVDRAGNINVLHYKLKIDPEIDRPKAFIDQPENNKQVGGEIRVTGRAEDDIFLHSVEIRISTDLLAGESNSLPTGGNRFTLLNGKYYYKNAADGWAYPGAGNEGWVKTTLSGLQGVHVSWFYNINGDNLLSPPAGKLRPVRIEVRALDSTQFGLEANNKRSLLQTRDITFDSSVPSISTPEIFKGTTKENNYYSGVRSSQTFTIKTDVQDEGGISLITASQTGMNTAVTMVQNGQVVNLSELAARGWRVTDTPQMLQNTATWESGWRYYIINAGTNVNWATIDATSSSNKEYSAGTMIQLNNATRTGSGAVVLKANVGIKETNVANNNSNSDNWNSQGFKYSLEFDVDSTNVSTFSQLGYGKTGNYTLNLSVEDNNSGLAGAYKANGTYTIEIDNFYPSTTVTSHYNASTQNFYVSGIAKDYEEGQSITVQGLSRVLVYFSRQITGNPTYKVWNSGTSKFDTVTVPNNLPANTTVYYNPRGIPIGYMNGSTFSAFGRTDAFYASGGGGNLSSSEWANLPTMTTTRTNIIDRSGNYTGSSPNVTNFPFPAYAVRAKGTNLGNVWESPHAMVIDNQELGATEDLDVDGTYAEMWAGIADKEWQARLDTNYFFDGPVNVHYLVMDEVGNSTHYSRGIYVGNNRPLVRDINLGTDMRRRGTINAGSATNNTWGSTTAIDSIDRLANPLTVTTGSDTVSTDIYSNAGIITTNFRIRNYAFNVVLNTLFGNGQKKYNVSYVSSRTDIHPSAMVLGNAYTIMQQGNVDWRQYGALDGNVGTTFVATGVPASSVTGRVYSYTLGTGNAVRTGNFTNTDADNTVDKVSNIVFNNFTDITDSTKDGAGDIQQANRNQRFFLIKVYDSTVTTAGAAEQDQLAHTFVIALDIDNVDSKRPSISVDPFYWESSTRNSLYNNSRYNGHIELEADLPRGTNNFGTATTGINDIDPKVSGQVSLRGTSFDNNVIESINFRITNHTNTATADNVGQINGLTFYRAATYSGGVWNVPKGPFTSSNQDNSAYNTSGWKFVIESDALTMDGHTVNWRLDFDSSFINNTASLDNIFTIVARDSVNNSTPSNPGTWAASMQTTEAAKTEHYRFDVVPYIREVVTPLSLAYKVATSAFSRSATGWYSVRDSKSASEKIGIKGFNLNGSNMTISVNGVTLDGRATAATGDDMFVSSGTASNPASTAKTHVVARMDNDTNLTNDSTILSGALLVRVNNIDSLNNRNNNAAGRINGEVGTGYNEEPNNTNNNILNDDRNMYVWSVGSLLNKSPASVTDRSKITLESASFRINETGRRLMAYANFPSQPGEIILNNNDASVDAKPNANIIEGTINRYVYLIVAADTNLDTGNNNQNWYIGGTSTTSTLVTYYNLYARRFTTQTAGTSSEANGQGGNYKTRITANRNHNGADNSRGGASIGGNVYDRLKLPRIHSRSTGTNASTIVMSYGDSLKDYDVFLHYGTVRNTGNTTSDADIVPIFGGDYSNNKTTSSASGAGDNLAITFEAMDQRVTDSRQPISSAYPYRGSMYTASASLKTGVPVIAWYDETSGNLLISYGNVPTNAATETTNATTNTQTWQARAQVVQANAGPFVDMATDAGNNVHLAYYDNNGGLWYAYIPANSIPTVSAGGTITTTKIPDSSITRVRVDTFLSAGLKIMINVRQETHTASHPSGAGTRNVPYISYYHGAFPETKFTVRTAWPVTFTGNVAVSHGTDDLDFFTGAWEVMTVPVENTPLGASPYNELIIANGVPRTSDDWVELTNSATGTPSRLSAYNYTYTNNKNVHKTILVGYMTTNLYEGAILKKDLY